MRKAWRHFKTIAYHKYLVAKGCFRIGLYWQGIFHDMSKYSPEEFWVGAKYYQGNRSPNNAEREALGYSGAWMHHMGRNKHHYEYWHDYDKQGNMVPVPMPDRYIAEMIMDRIAASKVYEGKAYTDASPLAYYKKGKAVNDIMHKDTRLVLERMLKMLAEKGEDQTFAYIRRELVKHRKNAGGRHRKNAGGRHRGNSSGKNLVDRYIAKKVPRKGIRKKISGKRYSRKRQHMEQ